MCSSLSNGDSLRWGDFLFRWINSTCSRKPLNYSAKDSVQHNNIANPQIACFIRAIRTFRYAAAGCHEFANQTRCEHVHIYSEQHLFLEPLAFVSLDDESSECWNFLSRTSQVGTWMPEKLQHKLKFAFNSNWIRSKCDALCATNTVMAKICFYSLSLYLLFMWIFICLFINAASCSGYMASKIKR